MPRRPHCASLAPPVCLRSVCQVIHGHREETTRPPPADGQNGNLCVIFLHLGHRVHSRSLSALTETQHGAEDWTLLNCDTKTVALSPSALLKKSSFFFFLLPLLLRLFVLQSFKTCPPSFRGHCWPLEKSTVQLIMIWSTGQLFLWTHRWGRTPPSWASSQPPTATCKSTHLIKLPISANYNAAYRRHLATIINALVGTGFIFWLRWGLQRGRYK